ncbi:MAG: phosphate transport system permease protein [Frankiaceae bacterium]|jgi:phosphate transport system permease protein|nr:phosphate transport system permease protein [Frankiaceae bacterium]
MTVLAERPPAIEAITGVAPGGPDGDRPRPLRRRDLDDNLSLAGAALGSLAFTWLLYYQFLPLSGVVGFVLAWYAAFLAFYAAVTWQSHPWTVVKDRLMGTVVTAGAVVVGGGLVWTIVTTFWNGFDAFTHPNFFTTSMAGVRTNAAFTQGGILHALVGSGIEIGIAVAIALPLGLGTAVYMSEVGGRFAVVVRTVVEAMTALPDLVAGLFIYTTLVVGLRLGRTGLAAALAIAITMLPIIARSAEVVLRVVPGGLREAGSALGASQWQTVWRVVLPTARPGLATALILGIARGIGETAPVLIVSGLSTFTNADPVHNPMASLPLFAYFAVRSPEKAYITRGYAAASVLLAVVLVLFVVVRLLARQRKATSR